MSGHLPNANTVECSVLYDGLGFESETCSWKESLCACDSAFSSSVCSSKQTDFSASRAADVQSEQSDVMVELLQILLKDDDGGDGGNGKDACDAEHTAPKLYCNSELEFWSWDDALWESNSGPAPDWEVDFAEIMDDWMLNAEMIALGGISDLETETTNLS
ncbi:hypothetical protein SUGI_1101160 [Cryptomeria japonica]|nr:hypothetical protein SUGI_1101160 [Cryptomeria japonica]